ncbi:MAG: amidohydrolase [Bacteroidetes bacterium]|jgi:cytosine/adenosine deaminase-related metal-dependent hydrolase|nr:amidohydrolase [Bacteroidota bacterium]
MRYLTADRIFSGLDYLPENTVLAISQEGILKDITTMEDIDSYAIEHLEGILCPGFVNTHCHLELSHLKGTIKQHTGIVDFGLGVMKHRNDQTEDEQHKAMLEADAEMQKQGIVAVGDISNTSASIKAKLQSPLHYHTFVELLALNPERADLVFNQGRELLEEYERSKLSASLAPHAPYSASLELIGRITNDCYSRKQPTSIHNQESTAENEFFTHKTGDYLRLYKTINIPIDYFKPSGKSSLQTIASSLNPKTKTLLVHNTFTNQNDLETLEKQDRSLYWCLCPTANLYIENTLPDIAMLIENCTLTLGTDSLASNSHLSIIEEINTILKHQPDISLEILLRAATYNGADFLGIEGDFGSLMKNRKCGINLIQGNAGSYSVKKLA